MKKIFFMFVLFILIIILSSCKHEWSGLEKYNPNDSNLSMCKYLLPTEDFMSLYLYQGGDYFLYENSKFRSHQESILLYLEYDLNEYQLAKEYIESNISLSTAHEYSHSSYMFYENLTAGQMLYELYDQSSDRVFPNSFNMIAFSDEKNTIVFMGFYIAFYDWPSKEHRIFEISNWDEFLNTYYSFYEW